MSNFKLFCFGFGQVAKYFVKNLIEKNYKFDLITTNTTDTQTKKISNLNYKTYFFKDDKFDNHLLKDLHSSNKVLVSIPPKNETDIVLNLFDKSFRTNKFDWVPIYLLQVFMEIKKEIGSMSKQFLSQLLKRELQG